jgi:hypothetical protein
MIKEWLKHLARLYLPVYNIHSDAMRIIYAGYSSIKKNYYARLLLDSDYQISSIGRCWFSRIPDMIDSLKPDLIVCETSRFTLTHFQSRKGYIFPEWATTRINIDRPLNEICKSSETDYPNVLRRIRKYNLTYEILTDNESFTDFYDKFYIPYITKRHGSEAFIEDLSSLWKSSLSPMLIAISEHGITIGMSLFLKSGDTFYFKRLGLLNGDEEYLRHGVIGAFYYFGIIEGQKLGCKYLDLGGTRPFLNDGLTKYKLGLGASFEVHLSPFKEYLWLGVNEHSFAANECLRRNPFMHVNKNFIFEKYIP